MRAVILAGGVGSRLGSHAKKVPKAMVKIGSTPLIEHQIALLKSCRIRQITICTGHLAEKIEEYLGNGSSFGVDISYSREAKPLGTAGCLKKIEGLLDTDFLVVYGDVMLNMDIRRFVRFHEKKGGAATIAVHPNGHPYDSDLVDAGDGLRVASFLNKPHPQELVYRNLVNAGLYLFNPKMLGYIQTGTFSDLAKETLPKALSSGEAIYAYRTAEYLKDIGTPARLRQVRKEFNSGKTRAASLKSKRRAFFLDRDGVLNKEVHLLHKPEQMALIGGAAEAVRQINGAGYLAIAITNQPVVARNLCSEETLAEIHKKLETLLGDAGAYLDGIYYCPHHPDRGYPEENRKYKIKCSCRKPGTGLIRRAAKDFNIDLKHSFMIGDRDTDIQTGINAGVTTILVGGGAHTLKPDLVSRNLKTAVSRILNGRKINSIRNSKGRHDNHKNAV